MHYANMAGRNEYSTNTYTFPSKATNAISTENVIPKPGRPDIVEVTFWLLHHFAKAFKHSKTFPGTPANLSLTQSKHSSVALLADLRMTMSIPSSP